MPIPDRPVAEATIETDWGQAVHDYTFAPAGIRCHSSAVRATSTTQLKMHLDTVDDDPGGYLDAANDQVEVPTGGDGLYIILVVLDSVDGDTAGATRGFLNVNGGMIASGIGDNEGGTHITVPINTLADLSAGDIISVGAQRRGGTTNMSVMVSAFSMIRVGLEIGAPT